MTDDLKTTTPKNLYLQNIVTISKLKIKSYGLKNLQRQQNSKLENNCIFGKNKNPKRLKNLRKIYKTKVMLDL